MCHIPELGGAHHESGRQVQTRQRDVSAKLNPGASGRSTGKSVDPKLGGEGGLPRGRGAEVEFCGLIRVCEAQKGGRKLGAQLEFQVSKASWE